MVQPIRLRNLGVFRSILSALGGVLLFGSACLAASDSGVIEVFDAKTRKVIACKKISGKWEAGNRVKTGGTFTPFKDLIATLKQQLNSPAATPQLKKRITKNLSGLIVNLPAQKRLCKQAASQQPRPTPSGTLTPIATATPSSGGCSEGCFNDTRLTACFGIPTGTLGSESSGQQLWATCAGCHVESTRRNRGFSSITTALATVPQMIPFASSVDNQDVADIAAYLNRYNPKQCRTDWP